MTTTMKLSEAIRLGATARAQSFGAMYRPETDSTCAAGAALDAVGCLVLENPMSGENNRALYRHFPITTARVQCPECDMRGVGEMIIWHLNDKCRWTREQIADWVATIEPQEAADPVPQAEAVTG